MIRRLRWKLILINLALAGAMLLAIFLLAYHFSARELLASEEAALKAAATENPLSGRPSEQDRRFPLFTIRSRRGLLVAMGSSSHDLTDIQVVSEIFQAASRQSLRSGILEEYRLRYYREDSLEGICFAFIDADFRQEQLAGQSRTFALIWLACMLGFLGISFLLARWAAGPVATAWEQQQQFVADASHELKTPLTVILTNAELMQQPEYSPEQQQQFSDNILTMARQMRSLVESLLQLARADNGQIRTHMEPVNLSELVSMGILPFEPAYFEAGMMLESRIQPDIFVRGNETYLRQILEILLDNGLKYATPTGPVQLTLERAGRGKCLLTVVTPGAPMTDGECRDIFQRFYRRDAARTDRSSYGLGLSIAQRIVREHSGQIWAKGIPGGNAFYVNLPAISK